MIVAYRATEFVVIKKETGGLANRDRPVKPTSSAILPFSTLHTSAAIWRAASTPADKTQNTARFNFASDPVKAGHQHTSKRTNHIEFYDTIHDDSTYGTAGEKEGEKKYTHTHTPVLPKTRAKKHKKQYKRKKKRQAGGDTRVIPWENIPLRHCPPLSFSNAGEKIKKRNYIYSIEKRRKRTSKRKTNP